MEKHEKNIGELTLDQRVYLPYLLNDTLAPVFNKILNLDNIFNSHIDLNEKSN